jgi:hypothetical protein
MSAFAVVISGLADHSRYAPAAGSGACLLRAHYREACIGWHGAQHGLQAARKHAVENHGLSRADLRTMEQSCGIGRRSGRAKR